MAPKRPAVSEHLREDGPPAVPRQSASAVVVRDGASGLELLLVQRNPQQRHMGGFWVFPGGALDAGETHLATAVRELAEEAGIEAVDPGALVLYSRWITPEAIRTRFDTRFFVVRAPADAQARADGEECVDVHWTTPAAALEAYARGELALVFPTFKLLEGLAAFATVDELLAQARELVVEPILPRVEFAAGKPRVLLPDEPDFDVRGRSDVGT